MSTRNLFKIARNAINSRRNKKLAKAEGCEPLEGDAAHIDENGGWNPLFIPEVAPVDAIPVGLSIDAYQQLVDGSYCVGFHYEGKNESAILKKNGPSAFKVVFCSSHVDKEDLESEMAYFMYGF